MRCEHLQRVSQLVDNELEPTDAARAREHLTICATCRRAEADFHALRQQVKSPAATADELERRQALSAVLATAESEERRQIFPHQARSFLSPRYAVISLAVCALLAVGLHLHFNNTNSSNDSPPVIVNSNAASWGVERLAGTPSIGANSMDESARLNVGEWLVTDESSRARVDVANIGHVEVDRNSRLRLVETSENEHRLALAQGRISALIYAPPRLFFVDTPSAVAVDYGCAYTLEVDEQGRSVLQVTAGWVALEAEGRESFVPAGAACASEKGKAPGTPYARDASLRVVNALAEVDFSNDAAARADALTIVLKEAGRKRDALTLWHLLARVEGEDRVRTFDRLNQLVPTPAGVMREGVLLLDREMLERWKDAVEAAWYEDEV